MSAELDDTMVYMATAPCGCAMGIECETSGTESAKTIAGWLKTGKIIDRVRLGDAKAAIVWDCPHDPPWGRSS